MLDHETMVYDLCLAEIIQKVPLKSCRKFHLVARYPSLSIIFVWNEVIQNCISGSTSETYQLHSVSLQIIVLSYCFSYSYFRKTRLVIVDTG